MQRPFPSQTHKSIRLYFFLHFFCSSNHFFLRLPRIIKFPLGVSSLHRDAALITSVSVCFCSWLLKRKRMPLLSGSIPILPLVSLIACHLSQQQAWWPNMFMSRFSGERWFILFSGFHSPLSWPVCSTLQPSFCLSLTYIDKWTIDCKNP